MYAKMFATSVKTHILCQFCFEFFFIGNIYKFFCKIFCIKHFSQQILYKILTNFIIL